MEPSDMARLQYRLHCRHATQSPPLDLDTCLYTATSIEYGNGNIEGRYVIPQSPRWPCLD